MKLFFLLLLCFYCIDAFRFSTLLSLKRVFKPLKHLSCKQTEVDIAQPSTLYNLPNTLAPLNDIITFIQWWGKKQSVQKDSVVLAQVTVLR